MPLNLLAQTTDYTTNVTTTDSGSVFGGVVFLIIYLLIVLVVIVGVWKMYTKAGKPGWASIIPIYNVYVLLKIAGRPGWWLLLFLIPLVNLVVGIIVGIDVARRFGHGEIFGAILCGLLGIGYAIIGFDSSAYSGSSATAPTGSPSVTS